MDLEFSSFPSVGFTLITTGWKSPVFFITTGMAEGATPGWHFEYESGAVCYAVRPLLALPEYATEYDAVCEVCKWPLPEDNDPWTWRVYNGDTPMHDACAKAQSRQSWDTDGIMVLGLDDMDDLFEGLSYALGEN